MPFLAALLVVLSPGAAFAPDERSPDDAIRRFFLNTEAPAIGEPAARDWLGHREWFAVSAGLHARPQEAARDRASARERVAAVGVAVTAERTTPEAFVFEGTLSGFPVTRAVWRDDFFRPTATFVPSFTTRFELLNRLPSTDPVPAIEMGRLARAPDRTGTLRLAALLWAQDYKESRPPARLLSERVGEDDREVSVTRYTISLDGGASWKMSIWRWLLVADKTTRAVTRSATFERAIAAPCPAVVEPTESRTAEGLTVQASIDPAAFTPRPHDRSAEEPVPPATITVRLSNPTDEDVYLVFRDDVLNFQVTDEQGARVWTGDEPIVGFGDQFHPVRLKPQASHEVTYGWYGWHWQEGALPPGVYQVRGTVAPRTCGAHPLTETLSTPVGFRILAAGTP